MHAAWMARSRHTLKGSVCMNLVKHILLLSVVWCGYSKPSPKTAPVLNSPTDFESVEIRLQGETIKEVAHFGKITGSKPTHAIKVIILESGLKALFKTGEYHYAEVAGYRLSKLLNINLVPPTVYRIINGVQGSLQLFIDAPDLASLDHRHKYLENLNKKALSDMKLFYYVAGQWDTHHGNQLIEKQGDTYRLWLIDNSSILHRSYSTYGGATFIEKGYNKEVPSLGGTEFPFDKAITIEGDYTEALKIFSRYIPSKAHLESLSKHQALTYVLWNNTLWLQYNTDRPSRIARHTKSYYPTTLRALSGLTRENLRQVWAELLLIEPESTQELIELTLMRRDEIIQASSVVS